jgi:hypothetical protein
LLALGLISHALEDLTGGKLHVEHIFSCEIEPFKQASLMVHRRENRGLTSSRRRTSSATSLLRCCSVM